MANFKSNLVVGMLIVAPFIGIAQTVSNGNFENWESVGSYMSPGSWITDNTESRITVSQDTEAYEGSYAMRVTALQADLGKYGEAYTEFEINYIPSSLDFQAKYFCQAGGVSVRIAFFNANDDEIYTESWFTGEIMDDTYTYVSIPLTPFVTPEDPPPAYARIRVSAEVGDFAPGNAWISVDAMAIDFPQSLEQLEKSVFEIFPNPTSEKITIQSSDGVIGLLKIFDAKGKMVFEKLISDNSVEIEIRNFSPGVYTLRSDNMNVEASTFIVQ